MARTNSKNTALAHTVAEPADTTEVMFSAVAAFIREHFPQSNAAALVVNVAPGLPPVVIALNDEGAVPAVIGATDDAPRR